MVPLFDPENSVAFCNQLRIRVSKGPTLKGDPWLTGMPRLKSQGWWTKGT